eukprot:TRINITY_DN3230_c0_g2_i2.p1 TRINITY_DN3230_c0_g2~~TRINITY_DN3230_c0_g2_i2.p1  ORF type:complete len:531 (+),score=83.42 TRINITY_DN3230_c0_g2_i2:85-1593(+)
MERTSTPRPKANGAKKAPIIEAANGAKVERKQTRPIGEFGGNLGCLFWTLFIPTAIWYFYGCVVMHQGALVPPGPMFWHKLIWKLPDGVSIFPTWKGFWAIIAWIVFQFLMEIFIPAKVLEGVTLKKPWENRLKYPMNGLAAFFLSHVVLYGMCYLGYMEPWFVWRNMGSLLTNAVIISTLIACWMYVDFGIFWERHVDDPEFEEDWGVFKYSECINDWWLGVARNPRILHSILKVPFDVKRFINARPSLTGWVIFNQSYMAAIYFNCRTDGNGINPVCDEVGSWSYIGYSAWLITLAHWYYIFDYNWNEPAYLTTTDIRHDLYGWMLSYGCVGFLMPYYSFAFMGHIAFQRTPLNNNPVNFGIGLALYLFGMYLFRVTNIEKHDFRSYIASGGDLSTFLVWGKPVKYIKTEEGSYLLTSGYWALARHFNYIGDMVMCIGWTVACSGPQHGFPWAPLSYVIYFWMMDIHRLTRDEERCSVKYKKDWNKYKELVPSFILPGLF